ncbi:hypothetical protein FRACYDRAFT_193868 [Fragilariopsis cylindrus CCMP1102]|uniref:Protein N-terminal glutamine amidohydrolase n=1 Tax=Fragilariopsis cylindrus CCMP1102 TaxID=635003 RepID=A0A1E7EXI3_9STRA|nr:hypothetical protein FRACYDRAFT_193868 [Fragilariopsis cylindrus CCMP1102]|eukprot:OEU10525.1 hypothetical protein FRACYDRAFT_193868 [Fragilariopsis cylindrus CCMP1102]
MSAAAAGAAKSAIEASSDKSLRVPCYCEENVWRLAYRKIHQQEKKKKQQQEKKQKRQQKKKKITTAAATTTTTTTSSFQYHVVFISNPKGCAPLFQQLAASDRDSAVFWDYHDVTEGTTTTTVLTKNTLVWDIDSYLPFPCHLEDYIEMVFPNNLDWPKEYAPYFRVIDASIYLRHFSSDRSHMYNSDTNTWNALPPSYDCILQHNENTNSNDDSSNNKDDDGNNDVTSNSATTTTTTTATTAFKQYMTISNEDVDYQQKNGEKDDNDDNNNKNENDDNHNHNRIFGRVYSISRLVERFGCSEDNNNALLPTIEIK